jgi:hypothetical protein
MTCRSRPFLITSYAAIKVYTAMVLPVFDYTVTLFGTLSATQTRKTTNKSRKNHKHVSVSRTWPSLVSRRKTHTAILVFKCLSNRVPPFLRNYLHLSTPIAE